MVELTVTELVCGQGKVLENAKNLLYDAGILLQQERSATSFFLMSIAIEELGKYILLTDQIIRIIVGNPRWNMFWKYFRSHRDKTKCFLFLEKSMFQEEDVHEQSSGESELQERIKMASLYTDIIESSFYTPSELISLDLAKKGIFLLEKRINILLEIHNRISKVDLENISKEDILNFYTKYGIKDFMLRQKR